MALTQSALSDLLDDIRAGGSVDVMREAMALVLQAFIEAEAAQAIGVARYERTDERITHPNGNRSHLLSTKAGDVELHILKFRDRSFVDPFNLVADPAFLLFAWRRVRAIPALVRRGSTARPPARSTPDEARQRSSPTCGRTFGPARSGQSW